MAAKGLTPFALALGELKEFGIEDHHVAQDLASGRLVAVLNLGALKLAYEGRTLHIYFTVPRSFWKTRSQTFWIKMGSPYPIEKFCVYEFIDPIVERLKSYEHVIDSADLEKLNALPESRLWVKPAIGSDPGDDWPIQARRTIESIKLFMFQKSNSFVPISITSTSLKRTILEYQKQYDSENPGPKDSKRYRRGSDAFWFSLINALYISNIGATQESVINELSGKGHKNFDGEEMTEGAITTRVREIWKECGLAEKRKIK
jgi:hypothetical protein